MDAVTTRQSFSAAEDSPAAAQKKKKRRKTVKFKTRHEAPKQKEELISLFEAGELDTGNVEVELCGSSVEVESYMGLHV